MTGAEAAKRRADEAKRGARAGWRARRREALRERAEAAQFEAALRTGRRVRGGTYTVRLPRDLSTGEMRDDLGREHAKVTLPRDVVSDPADRWTARRLINAANRAAMRARRTIRPRPSREAAQDAAATVVARILEKRHGTLPLRDDVTDAYLRTACHGAMIDAATHGNGSGRESLDDADAEPADVAAAAIAGGLRRAAQDALPLPDGVDPAPPHWHLSGRPRIVAAHTIDLISGPQAADLMGINPASVRVYLQRGRQKLAAIGEDALREAVEIEEDREDDLAALMSEAPPLYREPNLEWPARTDDGLAHPVRVSHAAR